MDGGQAAPELAWRAGCTRTSGDEELGGETGDQLCSGRRADTVPAAVKAA
jgi:hypothetical protein